MANNDPVSLAVWPSGRPVKKTPAPGDDSYPSRTERSKVTLRLPAQVAHQLRVFCARHNISAQDLVADLLVSHFRMDGQTATDLINDDLDDKEKLRSVITTSSSKIKSTGRPDGQCLESAELTPVELAALPPVERAVLEFYATYTRAPIKQRDRVSFQVIAQQPQHVIESGILACAIRFHEKWGARRRINSLKYCLGGVEEMSGASTEYRDYLLQCWQKQQAANQPNLPTIGAEVVEIVQRE